MKNCNYISGIKDDWLKFLARFLATGKFDGTGQGSGAIRGALERRGYIEQEWIGEDGRTVYGCRITPAGEQLLARARKQGF